MVKAANRVVLLKGGDWQGLYVNESLVFEDYRIAVEDAFNTLICHGVLIGGISFEAKYCDEKWLNERSSLPTSISEVKFV